MEVGASTACYYPLPTELAFRHLLQLEFKQIEVFFNAHSELTPAFLKPLRQSADHTGASVCSIHPYTSFAETNCLFSPYERRFQDTLEYYKWYFQAANLLGASILVIHGCQNIGLISQEAYFERFQQLIDLGKRFSVTVAQENVNRFLSADPEFLCAMKDALGQDFHLVFDIKQALRAGYAPLDFARRFAPHILHVHINDHNVSKDCLPPGRGAFSYDQLAALLDQSGYTGAYIIEFYSDGFDVTKELEQSKRILNTKF